MPFNLNATLRQSEKRRHGRPLLTLPKLDQLNRQNHQKAVTAQLVAAAKIVAAKGLLYKWQKATKQMVLVTWDSVSRQFLGSDNGLMAKLLGENFDLCDPNGMQFGLPHVAVVSRLWEALLATDLPLASWALQEQFRKAGK